MGRDVERLIYSHESAMLGGDKRMCSVDDVAVAESLAFVEVAWASYCRYAEFSLLQRGPPVILVSSSVRALLAPCPSLSAEVSVGSVEPQQARRASYAPLPE